MAYRPDLPNVLSDFTLRIEGGQKVGVVGRAGAGKSSILVCLFRMVEPRSVRSTRHSPSLVSEVRDTPCVPPLV